MLHEYRDDDETIAPAYAGRFDLAPPPANRLPEHGAPGPAVYRTIHDELLLDGSSRLNLATFVTTWMEPEAALLMSESFDKNAIDKDEYPQTAEIERRCVSMVAHLFHASEEAPAVGASTIGSSEAVMLAGLAMKWRWRAWAGRTGRRGATDRGARGAQSRPRRRPAGGPPVRDRTAASPADGRGQHPARLRPLRRH
jgi:glutamate decarboxylase